MELIRITTYVDKKDYDSINQQSYKGKKKDKKEGDLTFSEHLRKAIEEYNNKLEVKSND